MWKPSLWRTARLLALGEVSLEFQESAGFRARAPGGLSASAGQVPGYRGSRILQSR